MRLSSATLTLSVLILLLGCRGEGRRPIRAWSPSPAELPPASYPQEDLGNDRAQWHWTETFEHPIQDVYVAPTIHPTHPYEMGEDKDYYGHIEGQIARVYFNSPGIYTVKVTFRDGSVTPYIKFFYVAATLKSG